MRSKRRGFLIPVLSGVFALSGCGSSGSNGDDARPASSTAPAKTGVSPIGVGSRPVSASGFAVSKPTGASTGAPPTAPSGDESFFSGSPPAGVSTKATKGFAIAPGVLLFTSAEGWSGGGLPGYDYMAMSKDQSAVVRVMTSNGVVANMNCKEMAATAAMAPLRAKNLVDIGTATLRKVGKNQFIAREGQCSADGPKGPLQIHFIDLARKDKDGVWHYGAMAAFPKDAPMNVRAEAMAWARSLEFNGESAYTLP